MKRYILGYYVHDPDLLGTLAAKERRKILEVLIDSHPAPMSISEIASKARVNSKTVYGGKEWLEKDGFIRELDEREETGGFNKYVYRENVNSLTCDKDTKYYLAPGNVVYTEGFKNTLNKLIEKIDLRSEFEILMRFVRYIVEQVKESDEEQIAPKEDVGSMCSTCGLNHEARDFIRASLLYLLDRFERSLDYLEILKEGNYVDKKYYSEYCKCVETNLGQQISKGLVETQITGQKISEEEVVAEAATNEALRTEERITHPKTGDEREADYWFEKLKGVVKEMVEFLREKKPEMSMWQIMNSVREFKNDRQLRSYAEAVYRIIESFGISLPNPLYEKYLLAKRKRDEKRRVVAKRRKSVIDS